MKGSTHLAIGGAIGVGASLYFPFSFNNALLYVSVAGFSALSADLDGPSLLNSKLGKLSKRLHEYALWGSLALILYLASLYYIQSKFYPIFTVSAIMFFLLGFVTKEGTIRNALVSIVGGALLYAGWTSQQNWLIGFGLFVAWAPWLKHRGMTHTLWAVILWGAIGNGLEHQLGVVGITAVAVAGYVSHLLADTMTPNGVKWLYPFYKKSIKLH